jgi:hypothetical protein
MPRSAPPKRARPGRFFAAVSATLLGLLAVASTGGCSFLLADAPPARHSELPYFDCTSSRWLPNVDLTVAALYAVVAVTTLSQPSATRENDAVAGSLLLTGAFGSSAIFGYRRTAACREAKAELAERMTRLQREEYSRRLRMPDPWQAEGPPPAALPPVPPAPDGTVPPGPAAPGPETAPTAPAAGGRP